MKEDVQLVFYHRGRKLTIGRYDIHHMSQNKDQISCQIGGTLYRKLLFKGSSSSKQRFTPNERGRGKLAVFPSSFPGGLLGIPFLFK